MKSFVDLLASGRLDISGLTTHVFDLFKAPEAYDMIHKKSGYFAGVLIRYDQEKHPSKKVILKENEISPVKPAVGFIGAGSFAQGTLLPKLKGRCTFVGVFTASGNSSRYVADKYGFSYCAETADELLEDEQIGTVFIASRHDTHAEYILKALEKQKRIFVEKPLAVKESELEMINEAYYKSLENGNPTLIMVGFNRRFSPAVQRIKKLFHNDQPKAINIRVNASRLSPDHWVNDPDIGGGRIIGEACHFVDLAMYLAGSGISSVSANSMRDADNLNNTVSINLNFKNNSIASIGYFSNGNKKLPKEHIEVFAGGTVAQIIDFRKLIVYGNGIRKYNYRNQDKGYSEELEQFLKCITEGKNCPVPFKESYANTLATFKVIQSLTEKRTIQI